MRFSKRWSMIALLASLALVLALGAGSAFAGGDDVDTAKAVQRHNSEHPAPWFRVSVTVREAALV